MELDYKSIGKRVKIARIRAELTQEKLAEMAELSPTHLSNVETGTTRVSLQTMVNLANILGVTADDLLCDSILHARPQMEKDIADLLGDCDDREIRILRDIMQAAKESLRRDAALWKTTE
ncbi:MAG: helix-turn-helix transcriptional regulator [Clostridia bacterium]|nr:helix-turn-helix transcriptional regulator [Clostridia bacterium]MBQ8332709.1 helix-turn-helix transcriptional regulator [Clostridia bacterium]MBQ8369225.1 helix-turn-helix transcriptional regulator [Clostridia bacterium]MBQ8576350.1 helix-turn-helix transcriptional regulator [Clostridia bacterium]